MIFKELEEHYKWVLSNTKTSEIKDWDLIDNLLQEIGFDDRYDDLDEVRELILNDLQEYEIYIRRKKIDEKYVDGLLRFELDKIYDDLYLVNRTIKIKKLRKEYERNRKK